MLGVHVLLCSPLQVKLMTLDVLFVKLTAERRKYLKGGVLMNYINTI